jgi:hypothetical protein
LTFVEFNLIFCQVKDTIPTRGFYVLKFNSQGNGHFNLHGRLVRAAEALNPCNWPGIVTSQK